MDTVLDVTTDAAGRGFDCENWNRTDGRSEHVDRANCRQALMESLIVPILAIAFCNQIDLDGTDKNAAGNVAHQTGQRGWSLASCHFKCRMANVTHPYGESLS